MHRRAGSESAGSGRCTAYHQLTSRVVARAAAVRIRALPGAGPCDAPERHVDHPLPHAVPRRGGQGRLPESAGDLPAVAEGARPPAHPGGSVSLRVHAAAQPADLRDDRLREPDSADPARTGRHAEPQPRQLRARDHHRALRPGGGAPHLLQAERGFKSWGVTTSWSR